MSPSVVSTTDSLDCTMNSDTSTDWILELGSTPNTPPTNSSPSKVILTFHTSGTEDVELYQVFKEPLQWLDRDLDIFRESRSLTPSGNSHRGCYSHNTLDIPALAVVLYLKDYVSHGGINRLKQAQQYFQKSPWKLHHSEWVCGKEDNAIQYYVLTLDRPLYSIKAANTERIRLLRYVTYKKWTDQVQLYQFLLGFQPSVLKKDFCLFSLYRYADYEVQLALKRLPRGIVPKKTRKAEMTISVEDIGSLVAMLPHTCYRVSESRWCTRDLDGHKLYLDVKKVKKRSRSVSPSRFQWMNSSGENTLSVFKSSTGTSNDQSNPETDRKLSPAVFHNVRRCQSTLGGLNTSSNAHVFPDTATLKKPEKALNLVGDMANGKTWSKLTAYERFITTPAGGVHLSSDADGSMDSPDSGVFVGSDCVTENEVFANVTQKQPSHGWLENYIAKLSARKRSKLKKHPPKDSIISDTTSCDEEVDSVINPPVLGIASPQYSQHSKIKGSSPFAKENVPMSTLPNMFSFARQESTQSCPPQKTFGKRDIPNEGTPQPCSRSFSTSRENIFANASSWRRIPSESGEGDCGGEEIIVTNDPDLPNDPDLVSELANSRLRENQSSYLSDKEQTHSIIQGTGTDQGSKSLATHFSNDVSKKKELKESDAEESDDRNALFDSILLRKSYFREITRKLSTSSIPPSDLAQDTKTVDISKEAATLSNTDIPPDCTLQEYLDKNKEVSDFLLRLDVGNKDLPDIVRSNTSLHETYETEGGMYEREGGPEDCYDSPIPNMVNSRKVRFSDTPSTHIYEAEDSYNEATSHFDISSSELEVFHNDNVFMQKTAECNTMPVTVKQTYTTDDWQKLKLNPGIGFYI